MMVRMLVVGVTLICLGDSANAQRAGSGGRGARHVGQAQPGQGGRVNGVRRGTYPGRYSDSVEIYNFGYPVGPHWPRYRSRASYRVVPDPVTPNAPQPLIQVNRYAADYQLHAERLFRDGQFDDALRAVQHAIVEDPANGKLFLFQAQVLLAMGDYTTAANLLRFATGSLNPKDWGYMVENRSRFYKGTAYSDQIGKLEQSIRKSPDDGHAHFLLGYQQRYLGQSEEAGMHLSRAMDLNVHRELAEQLLARPSRESDWSSLEPIPVPPSPPTQP